jgi:N-carbamoylputrescine amidase
MRFEFMKDIRVAAVCMKAVPGQIDQNLETIQSFISKAADQGVKIICFPELSVTGYVTEAPGAICPPSVFRDAGSHLEMARSNQPHGPGLIESTERDKAHITQIVANQDGTLWKYRKTHLSPQEIRTYRVGEEIRVYRSSHLDFGIQLCYESHFPEMSTLMALEGVEAIFMPHASPRGNPSEKTDSWLRHLPSRAFDNGVYVIACNQSRETKDGLSFPGVVLALSPSGRILAKYSGKGQELVLVDLRAIELEEVRSHRMKYFLPHRRPELYSGIARPMRLNRFA